MINKFAILKTELKEGNLISSFIGVTNDINAAYSYISQQEVQLAIWFSVVLLTLEEEIDSENFDVIKFENDGLGKKNKKEEKLLYRMERKKDEK